MTVLSASPKSFSNSSSLQAPQRRYLETAGTLDSSSRTIGQLNDTIQLLVRVQWGPLIPHLLIMGSSFPLGP